MKYNIFFIILIIIILFILFNNTLKKNIIYEFLSNKNKIPLVLFKTGPFDELPNDIEEIIIHNCKMLNSKYYYFNDNNSRIFIQKNYNFNILKAYDSLIPTAYKADLFRYCVLYKYGGIYGDLTQTIMKNININKDNIDMLLVKDRDACKNNNNIQISFIATIPNNKFFKYLIDNITDNILKKRKGICPLDITGPTAFGKYFCKYFKISSIKLGINNYTGINNDTYKINIPFYMLNKDYIIDLDKNHIIKNKMNGHNKIIYKSSKNKYHYQWMNNIIYKII